MGDHSGYASSSQGADNESREPYKYLFYKLAKDRLTVGFCIFCNFLYRVDV